MVSPNTLRIQGKDEDARRKLEPPKIAVDKEGRPLGFRNGAPVIFKGKILSRIQRRLMLKKIKQSRGKIK